MKNTKVRDTNEFHGAEIRVIFKSVDEVSEELSTISLINWEPSYDLYIVDETIYVSIELPGVEMKDITLQVGRNYMIISGVKKPPVVEVPGRHNIVFHNLEISYGRFFRRIDFPLPVESRYGNYKLENGVLTVKFPIIKEHIIPVVEE
ncbi:MAG: Hsp20/alpha crystallin family protein [candidate division WOR-3 bacterium]|nr:Hsp20/alpha crystallin family protein [candidate division WOR-3 bacterium]